MYSPYNTIMNDTIDSAAQSNRADGSSVSDNVRNVVFLIIIFTIYLKYLVKNRDIYYK